MSGVVSRRKLSPDELLAEQMAPARAGPRVSISREVVVDGLVEARNALAKQMPLLRVTPSALMLKIVGHLLSQDQFRALNSRVEDDEVVYYSGVNVAVPVYTHGGVRFIVVDDVSSRPLAEIVAAITGSIASPGGDVSRATFMFVNVGVTGVDYVGGLSLPSVSASLSMGRIRRAQVYDEGRDRVRTAYVSYLTLTVDPRVVGPGDAGSFLASVEATSSEAERVLELA